MAKRSADCIRLWFVLLLAGAGIPSLASEVIGVSDGDTLTILHDRRPVKIRLGNIDAPEKKQPFGERSKQSLARLCFGKSVTYRQQTLDRYKRVVAVVYCDGVDVNRRQVELGMAWVYPQYNRDRLLPLVELNARFKAQGLWQDANPVPPWEFRRTKKSNPTHNPGATRRYEFPTRDAT